MTAPKNIIIKTAIIIRYTSPIIGLSDQLASVRYEVYPKNPGRKYMHAEKNATANQSKFLFAKRKYEMPRIDSI
jgi:hypothetical protein